MRPTTRQPAEGASGTERRASRFAWLPRLVERVLALRPVRVFRHYADRGGAVLSGGMSFQAVFALFAAIWVAFSLFGLVLAGDRELREAIFAQLNTLIPGLIGADGLIHPGALSGGILGWTGAIALAGLFWTALSWLGTVRVAVGRIFDVPLAAVPYPILLARDLLAGVALGVAVILSSALTFLGGRVVGWAADAAGTDPDATLQVATRILSALVMFALDAGVVIGAVRWVGALRVPWRPLLRGAALGGAALVVLQLLGSLLLDGAGTNPLLATFAAFVGLMIWLNLICQALLLSTAWIAVDVADARQTVRRVGEPSPATTPAADRAP